MILEHSEYSRDFSKRRRQTQGGSSVVEVGAKDREVLSLVANA